MVWRWLLLLVNVYSYARRAKWRLRRMTDWVEHAPCAIYNRGVVVIFFSFLVLLLLNTILLLSAAKWRVNFTNELWVRTISFFRSSCFCVDRAFWFLYLFVLRMRRDWGNGINEWGKNMKMTQSDVGSIMLKKMDRIETKHCHDLSYAPLIY